MVARDAFAKYPTIQRFCADAVYRKTFEQDVARELGISVDVSVRIKSEWEVWPKRWIVERSFAWLNNYRRLSKDYEISLFCSGYLYDCSFSYFIQKILVYLYSLSERGRPAPEPYGKNYAG